jgi:hypothetical protein
MGGKMIREILNRLSIQSGSTEDITRIKAYPASKKSPLDFNRILPIPQSDASDLQVKLWGTNKI